LASTVIVVPDLGGFKDVAIIDVLVKPGDRVEADTPLLTLETEKATMDVPSPGAGVIEKLLVKKGGLVSTGTPVAMLNVEGAAAAGAAAPVSAPPAAAPAVAAPPTKAAASPPQSAAAPAPMAAPALAAAAPSTKPVLPQPMRALVCADLHASSVWILRACAVVGSRAASSRTTSRPL
jgi:pyruvate dehydrogenase E2 component (dihydrolipoamide acetyltransferase)